MSDYDSVMWDRLSGLLVEYVENYILEKRADKNTKFNLKPTYTVDYVIDDIDGLFSQTNTDDYWALKIAACKNINWLPPHLKKLVVQFLPRFFEKYPEYKSNESLILK